MSPFGLMWQAQLRRKQILSSWRAVQYSQLTVSFSFEFTGTNRLFLEWFVSELGITCNITAATWLLRGFLNKRIWKLRDNYFLYKNTMKKKRFHIWKCHVTMAEKNAYISNEMQLQKHSLTFIHKKNHLFQLPTFYLGHPWLKTPLLAWTS